MTVAITTLSIQISSFTLTVLPGDELPAEQIRLTSENFRWKCWTGFVRSEWILEADEDS